MLSLQTTHKELQQKLQRKKFTTTRQPQRVLTTEILNNLGTNKTSRSNKSQAPCFIIRAINLSQSKQLNEFAKGKTSKTINSSQNKENTGNLPGHTSGKEKETSMINLGQIEEEKESISFKIFKLEPSIKNKENPNSKRSNLRIKLSECPICFEVLLPITGIKLTHCMHSFHSGCLKRYLESKIDSRQFKIACPMDGCSYRISEFHIVQILDFDYKSRYRLYSLRIYAETHPNELIFCPFPDCDKYFRGVQKHERSVYCPNCSKSFCKKCKTQLHPGITCGENQSMDPTFQKYLLDNQCRKCPNCFYFIHKIDGCNNMTCKCSYVFCYGCGNARKSCKCKKCIKLSAKF